MNANHDFERRLSDLYAAEGSVRAPDRVLVSILANLESSRQRRVLVRVPWRVPNMSVYAKVALAAVAVIAVGAIGLAVLRSPGTGPGTDTSPSPSPSPTAEITPSPSPLPGETLTAKTLPIIMGPRLDPGTYSVTSDFPVGASMDVLDGPFTAFACPLGAFEQGICLSTGSGDDDPAISIMLIENVVADPCVGEGLDPPVGASVEELAQAIAGLPGFEATTPTDVTVDGHRGKELTVTAPASAQCPEMYTWWSPERVNGVGAGETNRVRIFDVSGTRVVIAATWGPEHGPDVQGEVMRIVESVRFP